MTYQCEFGKYCCGGTCRRYCHRPATKYLNFSRPKEEIDKGRLAGIHFCDKHFKEEKENWTTRVGSWNGWEFEEFLGALAGKNSDS